MPRSFLCDVHIPPRLATLLREKGFNAVHTIEVRLETASDFAICEYARYCDAIVVTKDSDFVGLCGRLTGTRVIHVRLGNCSNKSLSERFFAELPEMLGRLDSGEHLIELI